MASGPLAIGVKAEVIRPHEASYLDPIAMQAGDRVILEDRSTEWPGRVWAVHDNGKCGWVPLAYLRREGERGTAIGSYSALELSVSIGDGVLVEGFESGWYLVSETSGERGRYGRGAYPSLCRDSIRSVG